MIAPQQEGRIEGFDVVLLEPSTGMGGYITVEQLAQVTEADDWRRVIVASSLVVDDLRIARGATNEGVAREIALYAEEIAKVPQSA